MTNRRWSSRAEPFIITPEIRASHLERSQADVSRQWPTYALEFPFSYLMTLLAAAGMPLEYTRWINRNKHKPRYWLARHLGRLERWWGDLRIRWYRIRPDAYEIGGEDDLRQFVAHMRETTKKGEYHRSWRLGRYWFGEPGDHLVNREIIHPKTNPNYLAGATAYRFDEYFFTFVVLPYRFREIEPAVVMTILFPETPLSAYEFLPDEHLKVWRGNIDADSVAA